jgi:phosphoserine phosphatase RsbU/P
MNRPVFGALYLESHFQPKHVSEVDNDLLKTISREAAALVDNAQLTAKEEARQHRKELLIAAHIQQGLMAVQIPTLMFADIQAHSEACSAVGGDFYDVIVGDDILNVAWWTSPVRVSLPLSWLPPRKVCCTSHYSRISRLRKLPRLRINISATRMLESTQRCCCCDSVQMANLNTSTADMFTPGCATTRKSRDSKREIFQLVFCEASYTVDTVMLLPGSRVILVSDGFTEAEDVEGNCFGEDGLDLSVVYPSLEDIRRRLTDFCGGYPASDDCTIVQVIFKGSIN